mgnify:CR=1 FL=1
MGILPILHYPDEILRKVSEPVETITDEIQELIDHMIQTMYAAPGVGLAANQVGVLKRIAVMDVSSGKKTDSLIVMINPEMLSSEGEESYEEGCLSVPNFTGDVQRVGSVQVCYMTREVKEVTISAEGLLARAIQHELDHLNGILFFDRLPPMKRDMIKRKIKKAIRQGVYQY